jgi:zinc resistance-associated protein
MAMMKQVLVVTFALSLTGASLALAQQGAGQQGAGQQGPAQQGAAQQGSGQQGAERGGMPWRPNAEDAAAFTDAHIAALKAGLKLTPEQEKNWPAVEAAIRDLAKDRADRMKARMERMAALREARRGGDNAQPGSAQPGPDAIARLREGADAMTARAANLKKLADAAEPLYKSLDDGQKHRFGMLLRMGGRGGRANWQRRG